MASERELNLLIRARDEASRVIQGNERAFRDLERSMEDVGRVARSSLRNIPEELRPIQSDLQRTGREFRELSRTAGSVDELADSLDRTRIAARSLTSVSESGRDGIRVMQDLAEATREAELAALGLADNGNIRLSTTEAQAALNRYQDELQETRQRLEDLRSAGNFGVYTAGMMELERSTRRVNQAMGAASQGGMAYFNTLQRLGIYSSNTADHMALAMEGYRDRFIQSVDMMTQRSTQGEWIQQNFERMGRPLQGITGQLNNISSGLERMSRAGMPAALALRELGPNASMRDLLDHVRRINQGLMRFQMLSIVAGIALVGFTAVMAKAAHGPDVAGVLQQQQDALAEYTTTLQQRTQEIYNAWGLFEKAQVEHTKPETLLKNLTEQVNIMATWSRNLASLAKKGVDEGLIAELRKMGPAAAGEIAALNQMSGPQLDQYVELWRTKHKLAKDAAITELAKLKEETAKKVQELQDTLKPLGIAFEDFKSTWADALAPFVETWGVIAAKVVDAGTAIGDFVKKLNDINPQISAAAGMFMYLFTAITLLLAPLAIGISRAGSMAAAFTLLWGTIGPLVTGFLAVAGYAAVIAAALVALGVVVYNLWKNSEDLRNALINGWNAIKATVMAALAPLVPALNNLKTTLLNLVSNMVGGTGTMQSIWKALGDKLAVIIGYLAKTVIPMIGAALNTAVTVVTTAINILSTVITGGVNVIKGLWKAFVSILKGDWSAAWDAIAGVISSANTTLKGVAKSIVDGIKKIIGGLNLSDTGKNIIQGLIDGITGMAGALWSKVESIASGIKDKIAGILDIHSPSRVAIELGSYFSEGLAIGIEKVAKKAIAASGAMAQGVINPVQGISTPSRAAGAVAAAGGGSAPIYVTFGEGAFKGAFPGVKSGEEVTKAISSISLKAAFKSQK